MQRLVLSLTGIGLAALAVFSLGMSTPNPLFWNSLEVTVTAYNSTRAQTDGTPGLAAWNNRLKPDMKAIAVSRDLLDLGLGNQTEVHIKGIDGIDEPYIVMDKMNERHERRIDLYFGKDVKAAREFGKQQATIYWR